MDKSNEDFVSGTGIRKRSGMMAWVTTTGEILTQEDLPGFADQDINFLKGDIEAEKLLRSGEDNGSVE